MFVSIVGAVFVVVSTVPVYVPFAHGPVVYLPVLCCGVVCCAVVCCTLHSITSLPVHLVCGMWTAVTAVRLGAVSRPVRG